MTIHIQSSTLFSQGKYFCFYSIFHNLFSDCKKKKAISRNLIDVVVTITNTETAVDHLLNSCSQNFKFTIYSFKIFIENFKTETLLLHFDYDLWEFVHFFIFYQSCGYYPSQCKLLKS